MRIITCLATCLAVLGLAGSVAAQCAAPNPVGTAETFDVGTVASTSGSCSSTTGTTWPAGWGNDPTTNAEGWRLRSGPTSSGGTGPSGDHTSGTGLYAYIESSSPCNPGIVMLLNGPLVDASTLVSPTIEFWYNMNGSAMGTLELEVFDGATWNSVFSASGDNGDVWLFAAIDVSTQINTASTACAAAIQFRFKGTTGSSFTSDMAIDDVHVGEPTPLAFSINTPTASMDIDGVQGDPFSPAVINKNVFNCTPVQPASGTFNVSALGNPGAFHETVFSANSTLIPSALALGTETVNIDISQIASYLNGGANLFMVQLPGAAIPGSTGGFLNVPFGMTTAFDQALQTAITSPAGSLGFELTQGVELHVASVPSLANLAGPTGDDQVVTFDPTAAPTCWLSAPWTMYGSTFTEMHVDSNGRLMAQFDGSDFSPTLAEAISGPPTLGIWTDLSPNNGGSINISNPVPGVIDVDFAGVPYFGLAGGSNTFTLEYDDGSGNLSLISDIAAGTTPFSTNLTSTGTAGNMWVGISPGSLGPATDPGIANGGLGFTVGGAGLAAAGTDMLYDFLDTSIVGAPNLPLSFNGTALVRIDFLPAPVGGVVNYAFNGL